MTMEGITYKTLNSFDIHLFHEGTHYRCYEVFGARPMRYNSIDGVSFTVWAPNAEKVLVVGDFNQWNGTGYLMKRATESGIWNIFVPGLREGQRYKYEIHTRNGEVILKSDPYAFYSEVRPNTAAIIASPDNYKWNDKEWMEKRKEKCIYEEPVNIYELHLGSWRRREDGRFYSYREIADMIIDYVKEMGYTHIEILPLTEHPFDGSWGYQTTGYYSITSRYGTPYDFMYLVDKCHQNGIGVILDWVPGHFCKDAHGLWKFDGTSVYEYDNPLMADNFDWGTGNFDHGKNEVVSFLISSEVFWFDKYHIDGLRVDAVSHMLYLDYGRSDGQWIPNKFGGNENLNSVEFLKKLNKIVFEYFPGVLMIAEESTSWPLVTAPTYMEGLGFNYKWNMGWMNDTLRFMSLNEADRKKNQKLITFSFTYVFAENYVLSLSHDEVVHGKKSLIEKMSGDYWQKFANLRALYGYMFAHPGKKLTFMGAEFAQFAEWNYKKELDWFLFKYDMHYKMKNYVKELNNLYKRERSLYELDHNSRGFQWIDFNHERNIIAFIRKGRHKEDFIVFICNFSTEPCFSYNIGVPEFCEYEEIFSSDWEQFGGSGIKNNDLIKAVDINWHNQPFAINIKVPALSVLIFKPKERYL